MKRSREQKKKKKKETKNGLNTIGLLYQHHHNHFNSQMPWHYFDKRIKNWKICNKWKIIGEYFFSVRALKIHESFFWWNIVAAAIATTAQSRTETIKTKKKTHKNKENERRTKTNQRHTNKHTDTHTWQFVSIVTMLFISSAWICGKVS